MKRCGEGTRALLTEHFRKYPAMTAEDLFKLLYQSSFGCEHMVSSPEAVREGIEREARGLLDGGGALVEPLDGDFCRVHLACLRRGLSAETLAELFFLSARRSTDGTSALEKRLAVAREMIGAGELPLDVHAFDAALAEWRGRGYPSLHHSDAFRAAYHPAYRVIAREYLPRLSSVTGADGMPE